MSGLGTRRPDFPSSFCDAQVHLGSRPTAPKLETQDLLATTTKETLCLGGFVTGVAGQGSIWEKCLETGLKPWHLCLPGKCANLFILCQELKQ